MATGHEETSRRLGISAVLNLVIVVAEVVGGLLSGSLALLSDALHNLGDVAALAVALLARRLGRKPPSLRHTFGLRRAEVLAALLNSATLLVVITLIIREAIERLQAPQPIHGPLMLVVALVGLGGNLASVLLLKGHVHEHDLNTRSAFIHLVQDTLSSVVVVGAALLAGWKYGPHVDAIASIIVALAVVRSGWRLLVDALHILLEGTPQDVDLVELQRQCQERFDIDGLHHVHVWETGGGERMLTAHIRVGDKPLSDVERTIGAMHEFLAERWRIHHATIEPEFVGCGSDLLVEERCHDAGGRQDASQAADRSKS
jgi:cobalt-zinc-cadmium efflux system protein